MEQDKSVIIIIFVFMSSEWCLRRKIARSLHVIWNYTFTFDNNQKHWFFIETKRGRQHWSSKAPVYNKKTSQ